MYILQYLYTVHAHTYVEGKPPYKNGNNNQENDGEEETSPLLGTCSSSFLNSAINMLVTSLELSNSCISIFNNGVEMLSLLLNKHLHVHKQLLQFLKREHQLN